jgi:hypothetical protein
VAQSAGLRFSIECIGEQMATTRPRQSVRAEEPHVDPDSLAKAQAMAEAVRAELVDLESTVTVDDLMASRRARTWPPYPMKAAETRQLANRIAGLAAVGQTEAAHALLAPILAERTPFRDLDRIGAAVGAGPLPAVNLFLERTAAEGTMGGWVVIAGALGRQLDRDLAGAFDRCRQYVIAANAWYATDILGERVPGPALVSHFEPALSFLSPWREDPDRWVRRTLGVAVHFWAKRARGRSELRQQAGALLEFLDPLFEERDTDAIKGVGWGLKTLGRHYPDLVEPWLDRQLGLGRQPRALMLRKARTYLAGRQSSG